MILWIKKTILIYCEWQVSLVSGSSNTANIILFLTSITMLQIQCISVYAQISPHNNTINWSKNFRFQDWLSYVRHMHVKTNTYLDMHMSYMSYVRQSEL
jgi:hypothetical protein